MQIATLLTRLCMFLQSRNNGNMSDFFNMKIIVYGYLLSLVCSCSVHVLDIAALIHTVRSVRAASFNYYIHMHLVPYLKSQITPSMMRWIRWHCPLDTGFEIRAQAVWGRARHLSVMEAPVLHTILTSDPYEWVGKQYLFLWNLDARAGEEPAISRLFKQTSS